jgi:23S rRNA (cytidine1920-2'-O)/16S rRNA (cytidine1409-2'-O)-methyltransferase
VRIDTLLVARGVVDDAKAAAALVLAGNVFVRGDHKVTSPAQKVAEAEPLRVRAKRDHPWVSRGGLKLSHALEAWPQLASAVAAVGSVGLDVGSSTGGFTDVLLANGCARVYSVDVGKVHRPSQLLNVCY